MFQKKRSASPDRVRMVIDWTRGSGWAVERVVEVAGSEVARPEVTLTLIDTHLEGFL